MKKDKGIVIRLTESELTALRKKAHQNQMSMAGYIRFATSCVCVSFPPELLDRITKLARKEMEGDLSKWIIREIEHSLKANPET